MCGGREEPFGYCAMTLTTLILGHLDLNYIFELYFNYNYELYFIKVALEPSCAE